MPDTPLQFIGTGFRFISWERAHPEVIELVYRCLVRNGMDRFVVLDPSHDMDAARATARVAKKAGGSEVIGALTYTISAVHDDAFYAGIAAAVRGPAPTSTAPTSRTRRASSPRTGRGR